MLTPNHAGLIRDRGVTDAANASFYGRFPYPWPSHQFFRYGDPLFGVRSLNLDLGAFAEPMIPRVDRVWVAGCGTNQAIETALLFPEAEVIGSDLSSASLENATTIGRQLGVRNLTLRQESINEAAYDERFDLVICTGVIHHNAHPGAALAALARAMRPGGILELMVYNVYHRFATQAVQEAVRMFAVGAAEDDFDLHMSVARVLMDLESEHLPGLPSGLLRAMRGEHEAKVADALVQPVEWVYNVAQLRALCAEAGVSLLMPRPNDFDEPESRRWSLRLKDSELRGRYESMADVDRWLLVNVLLADRSPMLWFYCTRSARSEHYEQLVNQQFLATPLAPAGTERTPLVLENGQYAARDAHIFPPRRRPAPPYSQLFSMFDGRTPTRAVLEDAGIDITSVDAVTDVRIDLASRRHPLLMTVGARPFDARVR